MVRVGNTVHDPADQAMCTRERVPIAIGGISSGRSLHGLLRINLAEEPVVTVAVDRCFSWSAATNKTLYSATHHEFDDRGRQSTWRRIAKLSADLVKCRTLERNPPREPKWISRQTALCPKMRVLRTEKSSSGSLRPTQQPTTTRACREARGGSSRTFSRQN